MKLLIKKCFGVKKGIKKKSKKPSHTLLLKFKELSGKVTKIRAFVLRSISLLRRRINRLARSVSRLSTQVNELQNQVNDLTAPINAIRSLLQSRVGTRVTIQTASVSVSGTVVTVGENFVQILESSGAIDLIPLSKINIVS